ncbi:hypothetical protein AALA79_01960 [Lachnospiraceae bacterium 64-25]
MSKEKNRTKQKLLNKIFSTSIIRLLSLPTLDGTRLTYGEAEKVLKYTMHLLKDEMKKTGVRDRPEDSECTGFEIKALTQDKWKEKVERRLKNEK